MDYYYGNVERARDFLIVYEDRANDLRKYLEEEQHILMQLLSVINTALRNFENVHALTTDLALDHFRDDQSALVEAAHHYVEHSPVLDGRPSVCLTTATYERYLRRKPDFLLYKKR